MRFSVTGVLGAERVSMCPCYWPEPSLLPCPYLSWLWGRPQPLIALPSMKPTCPSSSQDQSPLGTYVGHKAAVSP